MSSFHQNSPKSSTRIHAMYLIAIFYCPLEFTQNVLQNSSFENVHQNSPFLKIHFPLNRTIPYFSYNCQQLSNRLWGSVLVLFSSGAMAGQDLIGSRYYSVLGSVLMQGHFNCFFSGFFNPKYLDIRYQAHEHQARAD